MGHQRVSGLVICDDLLLFLGDHAATPLGSGDDPVDRLFELGHRDLGAREPRREQRGLVHDVREVGSGEPRRPTRENLDVDLLSKRLAARVHLQDPGASVEIGSVDDDLAVETPGT